MINTSTGSALTVNFTGNKYYKSVARLSHYYSLHAIDTFMAKMLRNVLPNIVK